MEEVRATSERYSKELKEKIHGKMSRMQENRDAQLRTIQERIREHVSLDTC